MRRSLSLLALALLPLAASQAHETAPAGAPVATTSVVADWAPRVAQYRVTMQAGQAPARIETWTLWRDAGRIALIKGDEEDVWLREPAGIRLQRLYHRDHKLVDYSAGELRTLRIDARWLPLGTLFDETRLPTLQREGSQYRGNARGEQIELEWDAEQRLPVHLTRRTATGSVHFERLASHEQAPPQWPVPSPDRSDYDRIDAADFGDMEYDPFVRKVMAQDVRMGWRTAHAD